MARRPLGAALGAVLMAAITSGCLTGGTGTRAGEDAFPIRVENETDVPVGLYVNGDWVGTYPAGAEADVTFDRPIAPPAVIELRSPTDAVLLRLTANEGALGAARDGRYGVGESLGLPCGVLTALVGTLEADEGLTPAASVEPGPCP